MTEYENVNNYVEKIRISTNNNSYFSEDLNNYFKIVDNVKANINDKINNIGVHSNNKIRNNGLGIILKSLTRNLDADDEINYNKIIHHLQTNEQNFEKQVKVQYSISN